MCRWFLQCSVSVTTPRMNHDLTDYYARALIVVVKSFIAHEAKRFTTFAFSVDEAPKSVFQIRTTFCYLHISLTLLCFIIIYVLPLYNVERIIHSAHGTYKYGVSNEHLSHTFAISATLEDIWEHLCREFDIWVIITSEMNNNCNQLSVLNGHFFFWCEI